MPSSFISVVSNHQTPLRVRLGCDLGSLMFLWARRLSKRCLCLCPVSLEGRSQCFANGFDLAGFGWYLLVDCQRGEEILGLFQEPLCPFPTDVYELWLWKLECSLSCWFHSTGYSSSKTILSISWKSCATWIRCLDLLGT